MPLYKVKGTVKIITQQKKKTNQNEGRWIVKRISIGSTVIALMLVLTVHAFAMLEQPAIIENNSSLEYQEIKPVL